MQAVHLLNIGKQSEAQFSSKFPELAEALKTDKKLQAFYNARFAKDVWTNENDKINKREALKTKMRTDSLLEKNKQELEKRMSGGARFNPGKKPFLAPSRAKKRIRCGDCPRTFRSKRGLESHRRTHDPKFKKECPGCKKIMWRHGLEKHMRICKYVSCV